MRPLDRKVLRDLWQMKSQMAAVVGVVAVGVASFVSLWSMYEYLKTSRDTYYREHRFADVFAGLKSAPDRVEAEIERIAGVGTVQTRVVHDVVLDVPGLREPATGRLISVPADDPPALNDVHVRSGRYPEPGARGEALVSEGFVDENGLGVGDTLSAVLNGRWQDVRIVGVGISPEYVYEFRGGQVLPDRRRFGILWMNRQVLASAFEMEGAFNDVSLALAPGASEQRVIDRLDRVLEGHGGLGAYGRGDQLSHRYLSDEIATNRITATVVPVIFLGVAAFLVHMVLARLVGNQRTQVGILKAFGYSDAAVGRHYLELAAVPVMSGGVLGTAFGMWLAVQLAEIYAGVYRFPRVAYDPGWEVAAIAVTITGAAAAVGALGAVRRAAGLPPAEAMQPESPETYRPALLERMGPGRFLGIVPRMVIRNLERRPGKAALTVVGIALAAGVGVAGRFTFDAVDRIRDLQFRVAERGDVTVTFAEPRGRAALRSLDHLPGVLRTEPFRTVPAELRSGHRDYRTALVGLPPDGSLRRVVSGDGTIRPLPTAGVLLSAALAERLGLGAGDDFVADVLTGEKPRLRLTVRGVVDEVVGTNVYLPLGDLRREMQEGPTLSGARLDVDPGRLDALYAQLKQSRGVASVSVRRATMQTFEETFARVFAIATTVLVLFSTVIAFGIVYNGARVTLSERARELASLRVLGYTRGEVSRILLGEQAVLTVTGIPVGLVIGYLFCWVLRAAYRAELFRLPLVVSRQTYVLAAGVVVASALLSAAVVHRNIRRMDLIEALKTRE